VAPLPVINDVFRCSFEWTYGTSTLAATNVLHFRASGLNPATLATALDAHITTAMWSFQNTNSKVAQINITPLDGSSVTFPFVTGGGAKYTGSGGGLDMMVQVCNIVKLVTGKRGRSYRGRLYLPWVAEGKQTDGTLDATTVTACDTAWIAFHTAMTAAGADLVVASYTLATAEDVVGVIVERSVATQRRRVQRTSN
jgi:hypothetical protein